MMKKIALGVMVFFSQFRLLLPEAKQRHSELLQSFRPRLNILIMDEPTAVLAPTETVDLFKTLKSLVEEGRSVIFISHKLNEVMEISDRVVILRGGRVVAEKKQPRRTPENWRILWWGGICWKGSRKKRSARTGPFLKFELSAS